MSEKVFASGSEFPPLKEGTLRLYSNRFCPYAERTRLVLHHLNIPYEVVNVHLREKPDWFLARNPLGLVPVLEHGNKIVYESPICNEYLDEIYGKHSLYSPDPYEKAQQKMIMERFSKVTSAYYGLLKQSEDERLKALEPFHKALDVFEQIVKGPFFTGDSVKMIDFLLWPWFERFPATADLGGVDILPVSRFPKLNAWVDQLKELPAVKASLLPKEVHTKFLSGHLRGEKPNYDIGLD